jgi:dipeptidyl-peptidase-4
MTTPVTDQPESYPRQEAATRRFRLGVPRAFSPAPDGRRLAFVRSAGGRDPVGSLWVAEADGSGSLVERCVVDARALVRADAELPAAERARRERMRETTSGITAYSADDAVERAVFSLDGVLFSIDLMAADAVPVELPSPGPVVDPRISPDGALAAYVCERSLYVVATDGAAPERCLAEAESATVSWGLADFVAAEELDRVRGLWWLAGSDAVLAERADEDPVDVRWIADPAQPEREPVAHRYPMAGTANPEAQLFRVPVDGSAPVEVVWDRAAYPYLATVAPDSTGGAVISVLSRDQQRQLVLDVADDGTSRVARERLTAPWVTMQAGVPCRAPGGALLEIVADESTDTFRLVADDAPLSPAGLQVTGVVDARADAVIVTAQPDPMDQGVYRVTLDGSVSALADAPGVHSAAAGEGGIVIASAVPDRPGTRFEARLERGTSMIASHAEEPLVQPRVTFDRVGDRELACAVLWPTGHVPGSGPLPVVMAPYGGPHHARVVHAASAFAPDQWLADQGFAVVVIDGAGTPGRGPAFEFEVSRDLASRVLDDQVAGLHALAAIHPDLDLTRVGITGWSFGGYLAALAVLDRPDIFHAAVAGAPVTDWALYDTAYTERYLGLPAENPDAYASTSLLARAERLERPLLIIHGLADDNVLVAHSLQLSSALLAAGRPHAVLPLSGVTHMTPQEVVAENLLRLEVGFLAEHLQR